MTRKRFNLPIVLFLPALWSAFFCGPERVLAQACCPDGNSTVTNFAGTGGYGHTGDGGPATSATFADPQGLAFDSAGNLYVVDTASNYVRKISPSGIVTTVAGNGTAGSTGDGGPATSASLNNPCFIAVDSAGNLYICEAGGNRVRKVDTGGIITTFAGNGGTVSSGDGGPATLASIPHPWGIAVDSAGNVLISDVDCSIRKVNTSGIISTIAGTGVCGYSGDGGPATLAQISRPDGPKIDPAGNIYFWDNDNYRIRMINSCGIITTIAGNGTSGFSGMGGPATLASIADSDGGIAFCGGNIYIGDFANSHLYLINSCGIINSIGTMAAYGDAFDSSGNLYLALRSQNIIEKMAPDCSPTPTPACVLVPTPTGCALSPTPTPTNNPTTPSPTATPFSQCDVFTVSQNIFNPSQNPVSIRVIYCAYPGDYSLRIFNTAGEHIRTLDSQYLQGPVTASYTWDGKNKYGDTCACGIYLFYLTEPLDRKLKKILLVK